MLGDFNAQIATNQATQLSSNANPNPLWLGDDYALASKFQRNSKDTIENLFDTELIKLCGFQDMIICNGIIKWPSFGQMTCIHRCSSCVVDYAIFDTQVLHCIVNFYLLNDHDPSYDHRHLSLTLNLDMYNNHMHKNSESQRHMHFDKSKTYLLSLSWHIYNHCHTMGWKSYYSY